jgi:hypothetical protein
MLIIKVYTAKIIDDLSDEGFKGKDLGEALYFAEGKVNDYWVDSPAKSRSAEEKEYDKKCSDFKRMVKDIKEFAKTISHKFVFNAERMTYDLIKK